MTPAMTEDEERRLAKLIADEIISHKRRQWIDPDTHSEHHEWIKLRMADELEWKKFRNKVLQSVAIWAMVIVVGFVAAALWTNFIGAIKKGLG